MSVGLFQTYDAAFLDLIRGRFGDFEAANFTAVLLSPAYMPNKAQHQFMSDIAPFEIAGDDYMRQNFTSFSVMPDMGAENTLFRFLGADLSWGQEVTIPVCRYMALVEGMPDMLTPSARLFGFVDLSTEGENVLSSAGHFEIKAPFEGWFIIRREGEAL